ncbi:hypothetical protein DPMN_026387 [Dreissena polymorpha]|uniref:Uncharacterized protein n=1 Tax=Dreissena polymorpha TaxID=45954 RepID=A0A9D4RE87_DREPO|nr:hypothetical protein DPMN_026387 [Dreissena polymorpha]
MSSISMDSQLEKWHAGPSYVLTESQQVGPTDEYILQLPEEDAEVRPEIKVKTTHIEKSFSPIIDASTRFSKWKSLATAFSILRHIAKTFSGHHETKCTG